MQYARAGTRRHRRRIEGCVPWSTSGACHTKGRWCKREMRVAAHTLPQIRGSQCGRSAPSAWAPAVPTCTPKSRGVFQPCVPETTSELASWRNVVPMRIVIITPILSPTLADLGCMCHSGSLVDKVVSGRCHTVWVMSRHVSFSKHESERQFDIYTA